jgi:tRNA pseudouridine55 synthase
LDGILNINKPPGITSFGIIARIKRLSGERHAGHAGTLDPDATGVLPVCLGRGTRIVEFLMDTTKTYRAEVELGITTDTYDASGRITGCSDSSKIDRSQMESALAAFRGNIRQVPPMYSAVKHRGQPLYKLARAGIEVELKSRPVKIHRLELTEWQPPAATLEIECSKGTYIRSLAHDLGQSLGCGAHLKGLVRTRCGTFDIDKAVSMPQLEEAFRYGYWEHFVYPIDSVLLHLNAIVVDDTGKEAIQNGSPLPVEYENGGARQEYCRAYSQDGRFLAILRRVPDKGVWHPKIVLI